MFKEDNALEEALFCDNKSMDLEESRNSEKEKKLVEYFGKDLVDLKIMTPKIKVDSHIVFQDWMYKRAGLLSNWKEHWFCLCKDCNGYVLRLIDNDGGTKHIIDLNMLLCEPEYRNDITGSSTIRLETLERNWKFMLPDSDRSSTWLNWLKRAIKEPCTERNNLEHSGMLMKRGKWGWRMRYCQLNKLGILCYFKPHARENLKVKVRGHIALYNAPSMQTDAKEPTDFSIEFPDKRYNFRAESSDDAKLWQEAIKPFIPGREASTSKTDALRSTGGSRKKPSYLSKTPHVSSSCDKCHHQISHSNPLRSVTFRREQTVLSSNSERTVSSWKTNSQIKQGQLPQWILKDGKPSQNSLESSTTNFLPTIKDIRSSQATICGLMNALESPSAGYVEKTKSDVWLNAEKYPGDGFRLKQKSRASQNFDAENKDQSTESNTNLANIKMPSSYQNSNCSSLKTASLYSYQIDSQLLVDDLKQSQYNFQSELWQPQYNSQSEIFKSPYLIQSEVNMPQWNSQSEFKQPPSNCQSEESTATVKDHGVMDTDTSVDEDWSYNEVMRNAFYRFAGVTTNNDSDKMSKGDLRVMLKCLGLERHCGDLFNKLETDRAGLFSFGDFIDVFANDETCTFITSRSEYKYLVVTLMTMDNIDSSWNKRVSKREFFQLVKEFSLDVQEAEELYKEYDTDRAGLHVANLFDFFKESCDLEDEALSLD